MKRARLAVLACLLACGARSGFQDDAAGDAAPSEASASDAATTPAEDAGTTPIADADAGPARACHLIQAGDPFKAVSFDDPKFSFRQDGFLGTGGRVVQYGNVEGMRTGGWDDPPIFAAEYDVSTWPPNAGRAPTQLFQSMHDPADLLELPNGKLALVWWFDNDGLGPRGVKYRTFDRATWTLDPDRFLVQDGSMTFTRPALNVAKDLLVSAYGRQRFDDGSWAFEGWLGFFGLDGSPHGEPLPLWSTSPGPFDTPMPSMAVAPTESDVLLALAFPSCEGTSPYCEARAIVVFRASPGGLEKASSVPLADPTKIAQNPRLLGDGAGHTWLSWWEIDAPKEGGTSTDRALFAVPLTKAGVASGPVERWYADGDLQTYDYFPTRQPSIGPLGVVYPSVRFPPADGGPTTREVHLVHRQLDREDTIEDLTFTTAYTSFPVEVAQIASPRALIVGYSTYPPGSQRGFGEIRRYVCREDQK